MEDYKIIVVETTGDWEEVYPSLYAKSLISENPAIHLVGVDCEYIDKFGYPESFSECKKWLKDADKIAVCKLQFGTESLCIVLDLCKLGPELPLNLIEILKSDTWIKCGIGLSGDMTNLSKNYLLDHCNGVYDLKVLISMFGCDNPNLCNTYTKLYGSAASKKDKSSSITDWSKSMTIDQIKYAAHDAYLSYMIGVKVFKSMEIFMAQLFSKSESSDSKNLEESTINTSDKIKKNSTLIIIPKKSNNYVGMLMEYAQRNKIAPPIFKDSVIKTGIEFKCECEINGSTGILLSIGIDSTKKKAKHNAAGEMLKLLKIIR